MKKISAVFAAFLLAGNVFCFGSARGRVARGAVVGGVEVGGMPYAEAERAVREQVLKGLPPFTVHAPSGDYAVEYSLKDDVAACVRKVKTGQTLSVFVQRTWADAEEFLLRVCRENARDARDASVSFSERGFEYTAEEAGTYCPLEKAVRGALAALAEGKEGYTLEPCKYLPKVREETLRARTRELARFTTRYDGTNRPRSHNIVLAAARISGTELAPAEEFSFNRVVGKRTAENGFAEANVITGGEFVRGIGGGVCQTSTTLFNAALRAGLKVTESRPHSLSVSYVPPSLDAMVSEYSDLKFLNPYPFPVYLLAEAGGGKVTFRIFGAPDGRRYETESVVLSRKAPPPAEETEGEEDKVLRAEKEGVTSESYLLVYEGETLLARTRIRRDVYACVSGKVQRRRGEGANGEETSPNGRKNGEEEALKGENF